MNNSADYIVITGNLVRGDNNGGYIITGVKQLSINGGIPQVVSPGVVTVKLPTKLIKFSDTESVEDVLNDIELDSGDTIPIDTSGYAKGVTLNDHKTFTAVNSNLVLTLDTSDLLPANVHTSLRDAVSMLTKITHNGNEYTPTDNNIDLGEVESNGYKPPDTGIPISDFNLAVKTLLQKISSAITAVNFDGIKYGPSTDGGISINKKYYQKPSGGIPFNDLQENVRKNLTSSNFVESIKLNGTTYPAVDRNINLGSIQTNPPVSYLESVQGNLNDSNDVDDLTLNIYLKIGDVLLEPVKGEMFITQDDLVTAIQFRNQTLKDYMDFLVNKLARKITYSGVELSVTDGIADFSNRLTDNGSQLAELSGNIVDRSDINHPVVKMYLQINDKTYEPTNGAFNIPAEDIDTKIKYYDTERLSDKVKDIQRLDITSIILNGYTYDRTDATINIPVITGIEKTYDGIEAKYFSDDIVNKIDSIFDNVQALQLNGIQYDPVSAVISIPNINTIGYHKPETGILKTTLSPELQALINSAAAQYALSAKTIKTAKGNANGVSPNLTTLLNYYVKPEDGIPESALSAEVQELLDVDTYAVGVKSGDTIKYPEPNGKTFLGEIEGEPGTFTITIDTLDSELKTILEKEYNGIDTITIGGTVYSISLDDNGNPTSIIQLPGEVSALTANSEIVVDNDTITMSPKGLYSTKMRYDSNMSLYGALNYLQQRYRYASFTITDAADVALHNTFSYNTVSPISIDWGDGTSTVYNPGDRVPLRITHTYPYTSMWAITYSGSIARSGYDPNGQQYITSIDGNDVLFMVTGIISLERKIISGSWKYDAADMFYGCTTLVMFDAEFDSSNIPATVNNVSYIMSRTFMNCTAMVRGTVNSGLIPIATAANVDSTDPANLEYCYHQTFKGCRSLSTMYVDKFPDGAELSSHLAAATGTYLETFADCGLDANTFDNYAATIVGTAVAPTTPRSTFSNKFVDYDTLDVNWKQ